MNRSAPSLVLAFLACAALMMAGCDRIDPDALLARAEQAALNKEYRSAILDLKSVLQENPQHAKARWLLSEVYLDVGDGASAAKELRRAQELGVGQDAVLPALSRALLLQKRFDQLLALEVDNSVAPNASAEVLAMKALAYIGKGEPGEAKSILEQAEQKAPHSIDVRFARARLLSLEGQADQAMAQVQAINQQDPQYGAAWSLRGDLLLPKEEYAAAEDAFTKAIQQRPYDVEDRSKRALVRASMGKSLEAAEDAAALQKMAPAYHMGYYLTGVLHFQDGRLEQAKDALERALDLSPQHFHTIFALASIETRLGNANRARQLSEQAAAMQPNYIPARELSAHWLIRDGKGAEAEQLVRPITVVKPEDQRSRDLLAASLLVQGRTEEAAEIFRGTAERKTDDFDTQLRAGAGLLAAGDAVAGTKMLERAVEMSPENPIANARLVAGLMQQQATNEGLRAAEAYLERKPNDPGALNLLAMAQLAAGNRDAAVATYERALQTDPGNLEASRRLATLALQAKDQLKAIEYSNTGLSGHSSDLTLLLIQAQAAKETGDAVLQEKALQMAIDSHPDELGPKALMARLLLEKNDPEKALLVLSNISDDKHSGVLYARAEAYYRLNRISEARRDLEALAVLAPDSVELQYQLARIYDAQGDLPKLETTLNRILAQAPDDARARVAKARLAIVAGRLDEARALLESQEVAAMGESTDVLLTRVALAQGSGDRESEVDSARRLYSLDPNRRHLLMLSRASVRNGDATASENLLLQWLRKNSDDVVVMSELANHYVGQGKVDDAVAMLRKIEAIDKNNLYALNNLAWYLRKLTPNEARSFGRRAFELAPDEPTVIDTYAVVLAESKDYRAALSILDKAIQQSRDPAMLELRRAMVLDEAGDRASAIAELQRLAVSGTSSETKEQAGTLLKQLQGQN